jgi:hypothetical protein
MIVLSFPVFLIVLMVGGVGAVVCAVGALSKRTEVFGRVGKHRGEAVGSSVVEMVQIHITVTHVLVQLGTLVYSMDEGPIREHLEHPVPDYNQAAKNKPPFFLR